MVNVLSKEQITLLKSRIASAQKIVCIGHVNPDGDAMGSTLAVCHVLRRLGKECHVAVPNRWPDFLSWMPGSEEILRYDKKAEEIHQLISDADILWICDLNESSRVQNEEFEKLILDSKAWKTMTDHHLNPEGFCDMLISHPEMSATCELLCYLFDQLGWLDETTVEEATCLYTGMMTDTGAFTFNSNRADVFECIGRLIGRGIDKDRIYRNVFWTASQARMRLTGYLLYVKMEIVPGLHASIMTLDNRERKMLGVKNGDTEGIVNMPLQIEGMKFSCLLTQDTEHPENIRLSLRSVDDFPCNEMSGRFFNGGGHKNAAGGRLECSMDEAVQKVREAIEAYRNQLN